MPISSPADLNPRLWVDCRDAVWSGSNLASIVNAGDDGGSGTLVGTPTKGDQLHGFDTIRIDSDSERIDVALGAWSSGELSYFWYGKSLDGSSHGGILGSGWPNSPGTGAVACYIGNGSDSFNFGNGCCSIAPGTAPSFKAETDITDTDPHTVAGVFSTTNAAYLDGSAVTLTSNANAATPNYGARTWHLGGTGTANEALNGDTFAWLIFDTALSAQDVQDLRDYFTSINAAIDVVPGVIEIGGAQPSVVTSDHKSVAVVPGAAEIAGAIPTVRVGTVVNVVPGAVEAAGAVPAVVTSENRFADVIAGSVVISGAVAEVTVAQASPNIAVVPGGIVISGAVLGVENFAPVEPLPSTVALLDTFPPFGSEGGPGDGWVIGVGVDPLVLDAHLGKDLLLIAETFEPGVEGDEDGLDLFAPFGAEPSGAWADWIDGRRTVYVAATSGRSTANDDEPPAEWVPGRLLPFNFETRLFDGVDPLARGGSGFGVIRLQDPDGVLNNLVGRVWDSAPLTLKRGPRGTPFKTWPVVGRFRAAGLIRDLDEKQIRLRDLGWQLDAPLHDETYAGTGGLEGDGTGTAKEGVIKPWALGPCFNVEPHLLSAPDQIFQWSLSSSQELVEFRHGGVPINIDADYVDYAALAAAVIPSGECATCLAQSLVRPNLTLQFGVRVDVIGDADVVNGHPGPLTRASIFRRVATHRGQNRIDDAEEIDVSALNKMEAYHTAPVGWFFGDAVTKAAALDRILAGILGWWRVRPDGRLTVGWVEAPELLSPAVTFDFGLNGMGKPRQVETSTPRRGTRIAWKTNYAPQPDRTSLAGSVSDADAAIFGRPARYAQSLMPAVASIYPTAALVTIDEAGFRDEADAVAEAARQQNIFATERARWEWDQQVDPLIDLVGSGAALRGAPEIVGEGRSLLCVGINALGSSTSTFEFFV